MKRIYHTLRISLLFLFITVGFTSCEYQEGVELDVHVLTVDFNDWVWNPNYKRYECLFEFDEITERIYEKGFVNAQIFVWEENRGSNYETLKPLPFVQSYYDPSNRVHYTETISYDVSPGYILFSIQLSDLYDGNQWLKTYSFKVSIMK